MSLKMTDVFAGNLIGKLVMNIDGTALGELTDITINRKSGDLLCLLIDPDETLNIEDYIIETNEQGYLQLSADRIRAVKDYIVVQRDLH
jgi:sporulation protein YlmC with PRC-barrel domain